MEQLFTAASDSVTVSRGKVYSLEPTGEDAVSYERLVTIWKNVNTAIREVLQPPHSNLNPGLRISDVDSSRPSKYDNKNMYITVSGIDEVKHRDISAVIEQIGIPDVEVQEKQNSEGGIQRIFKIPVTGVSVPLTRTTAAATHHNNNRHPTGCQVLTRLLMMLAAIVFLFLWSSGQWQDKMRFAFEQMPMLQNKTTEFIHYYFLPPVVSN